MGVKAETGVMCLRPRPPKIAGEPLEAGRKAGKILFHRPLKEPALVTPRS